MLSTKTIASTIYVVLLAACASSAPTVEGPSQGGIPLSQCQRIDEAGSYQLTTDLEGAPLELSIPANMAEPYTGDSTLERTCIEITASDVTLDCKGDGYPTGSPAYESDEPIVVTSCGEEYFPCQLWCNIFACDAALNYPPAALTDAGVLAVAGSIPEFEDFSIASVDVPSGDPFFLTDVEGNLDLAGENDKPSSILSIDGRLYFAGHAPAGYPVKGYLAYSLDRGRTWTQIHDSPWGEESVFRVLILINMGQGYDLNEDGFVYGLGVGSEAQGVEGWVERTVYLARVPKESLEDYTAFEYFTGMDGESPCWSAMESQAAPLGGLHTTGQGSAMYHEGTGRYLFLTTDTGSPKAPTDSGALFEAPNPWGPWRRGWRCCVLCPSATIGALTPFGRMANTSPG